MPSKRIPELPAVSVVIIGRNEAQNIRSCIESVFQMDYPSHLIEIIYVDTGSEDGTVDIARTTGIRVIEVKTRKPSPAIGRNRGLAEARHGIIHFIDGDMMIDSGYLKKAVEVLQDDSIACVFGRVNEKYGETNWISRVLNIDWKRKQAGFAESPGAGGTFRKEVLEKVGGYNELLTHGEEIDIGIRLRELGYKIYMIDAIMGIHDYGIWSLIGLVRRYYAMGKGRFRIIVAKNVSPKLLKWALVIPKQAGMVLALMGLVIWFGHLHIVLILTISYPIVYVALVLIRDRHLIMGQGGVEAFLYSYLYYMMKPVILLGMLSEAVAYIVRSISKSRNDY